MADLRDAGFTDADLVAVRRQAAPAFVREMADAIDWGRYGVVGFTTTFDQNVASIALARMVKERHPQVVVVFGGANCAGEMGRALAAGCPWIDYVVDGEGDEAFVELLGALAAGDEPTEIAGVVSAARLGDGAAHADRPLDELPVAEFGEYYERARALGLLDASRIKAFRLPFEASRGCWWGQKHHCTFCGLNGQFMGFRQKSARRVLDELAELARRHGVFRFDAVDNIMPADFLREFLPVLAKEERTYDLFFEIKSNIGRDEVRALSEAGVNQVQPGVESFSSNVLRLMRKGVSGIQNVNLLRWARYYEIGASWNVLIGFPGERAEDYDAQAELIGRLTHLEPPYMVSRAEVQRFSPFHFDRERFPVKSLVPGRSLAYVYPAHFDFEKLAFYFEHQFEETLPDAAFEPTRAAVERWKDAWAASQPPTLTFRWSPGLLHLEDARGEGPPKLYAFEGEVAQIYRGASDRPVSPAMLGRRMGLEAAADEIAEVLDLFVEQGLAMRDQGQYLALAIPDRQL